MFNLYANVRPCRTFPNVEALKPNIDLVVVRENTEGLYSGAESLLAPGVGIALRIITHDASLRVAEFAFKLAMQRKKHLTYIHKGNILRITDGIFKDAVKEAQKKYPEVEVDDLHIDAATMQLIKQPEKYDVMVTTNLFGDIISDEAAQVTGSLGLAAGANIGETYGMFEPVHGSAPKYTGMDRVNPIATIMAGAMMLDYLGEKAGAKKIEDAVIAVLKEGKVRTHDLAATRKAQKSLMLLWQKSKRTPYLFFIYFCFKFYFYACWGLNGYGRVRVNMHFKPPVLRFLNASINQKQPWTLPKRLLDFLNLLVPNNHNCFA